MKRHQSLRSDVGGDNHSAANHVVAQLKSLAEGLAATFAPFCEVVVHDLRAPEHAILAIHNNLSGRTVGQPATELGLARIADPAYPEIIANYQNFLPDGRQVKSTSIGVRDAEGQYVAALCLNIDLTLFRSLQGVIEQFTRVEARDEGFDTLSPMSSESIRAIIDDFAAQHTTTPRALKAANRRTLLRQLKETGCFQVRRSSEVIATHLGISRATVYADVRTGTLVKHAGDP